MRGAVMRSEIRFDLDNSADPLHSAGFVNQKLSKQFLRDHDGVAVVK